MFRLSWQVGRMCRENGRWARQVAVRGPGPSLEEVAKCHNVSRWAVHAEWRLLSFNTLLPSGSEAWGSHLISLCLSFLLCKNKNRSPYPPCKAAVGINVWQIGRAHV